MMDMIPNFTPKLPNPKPLTSHSYIMKQNDAKFRHLWEPTFKIMLYCFVSKTINMK